MPQEKKLWQHKQIKRNAVHTEPPVVTLSHWHKNDKCRNTLMHNMELFKKIPRILIEQDAHTVLFFFKRQLLRLFFDEQILGTNHRYIPYCRNKKTQHSQIWQYYNDVGDISQLHFLPPVKIRYKLLNSILGQAGTHPDISKKMQKIGQKCYFHSIVNHVRNWVK